MIWLNVALGCDEACRSQVIEVWLLGGLVVYPTDTVYGLGADVENEDAVRRVYKIKRRSLGNPLTIAVSNIEMAEKYAMIDEIGRQLMERFLPGKVTLIFPKTVRVPDIVNPRAIGIRIPNLPMILDLIESFGRAITSTSANKSGSPPKRDPRDAIRELRDIDLVLDYGVLPQSKPSTIIDLTSGRPKLVREGDVLFIRIMREYKKIASS